MTDPEFQRWNSPLKKVTDIDGARDALRARAESAADGSAASFRVTDEATGATLGHISVREIDTVTRSARVGYWVLPPGVRARSGSRHRRRRGR